MPAKKPSAPQGAAPAPERTETLVPLVYVGPAARVVVGRHTAQRNGDPIPVVPTVARELLERGDFVKPNPKATPATAPSADPDRR